MNLKNVREKRRVIITVLAISVLWLAFASMVPLAQGSVGGILWVRELPSGVWEEVGKEVFVEFGKWYQIEVRDLPCDFDIGEDVEVNIAEDGWTREAKVDHTEGKGKFIGPMDWYCDPEELEYCHTYTVKYRAEDKTPPGTYRAMGIINNEPDPKGGHLHAIPEYAFGSLMAVLSLLSGLGFFSKLKRK